MKVIERIASLRSLMLERGIDGYVIYGTDPHLSEYVTDAWRTREWISGFTGSYGKVAITQDKAVLWTDSRYFIQAESQLSGSGIEMLKDRQPNTISLDCWLEQELNHGGIVAIDGLTLSATEAKILESKLGANGITLKLNIDLVSPVWKNRPILPRSVVSDFLVKFAGCSRSEKLSIIRNQLKENGAESTIICQLDDLAWSFNLRGSEINNNPLFTGYGYVDQRQAILFIDEGKVPPGLIGILEEDGILIRNYESIFLFLEKINAISVYLDPDRTNSLIYRLIAKGNNVTDGLSIPTLLKSIKNEVEIQGMKNCHVRDGAAMVNFLYWFDHHIGKEKITELTIGEKLKEFRSEQANFMGESFNPIVGFGYHGAIVHYIATSETEIEVEKDGILLFDTGGQYLDGTTDITRTIATGKITSKQQSDFTLVLKGNIQLAKAIFPENTKGYSLDTLARKALWNNGLNYGHGTGHGVGHYLSVHEGPMSIRPEYNAEPIRSGQVITNEPGLYREGEYGIRTENVMVCKIEFQSQFGQFLSFETISMCPIDRRLINKNLLEEDEIIWLNSYHLRVLTELGLLVNPEVLKWLKVQCEPI
jgi:Xaa-Pro aminopeptidase